MLSALWTHLPLATRHSLLAAQALLGLRVADISCGSGHILLAAARRIATELAIVRTGEEQPSPTAFRAAIRDVIRECIYGVDLNPLAVELCKVALWLEAHSPGEPLNFLDHHIKCGNAIVGYVRQDELERGVPDEAFATTPGDDKDIASHFRKKNKAEREGKAQTQLDLAPELQAQLDAILLRWREISGLPERNPADIEAKKKRYEAFTSGPDAWLLQQIACLPIAQFYLPKTAADKTKLITDEEFRAYLAGRRHPQGQATAAAWATAHRKRFFHWFLEFPDIIARGGFDCILGNPPYVSGLRLSTHFGYAFLSWVYYAMPRTGGTCDLVAYFIRRIFDLIKPNGFLALISTNTIAQGDTRTGGLQQLIEQNGSISFAVRSRKWPGQANVEVSLIGIKKGKLLSRPILENREVETISSYLSDEDIERPPVMLSANEEKCFVGSFPLGKGFVLEQREVDEFLSRDPRNQDVLFKYLIGDDLNSRPDQSPSRWIINFFDWPLEKAQTYEAVFAHLERTVKQVREKDNRKSYRDYWWQYAEKRPQLYAFLKSSSRVLVSCRVTKYLSFSTVPNDIVYDTGTNVVLEKGGAPLLPFVQSNIHESWARKYGSTLESRLRYTNEECFKSYPFPVAMNEANAAELRAIGAKYEENRRDLMDKLSMGLTKFYNLVHNHKLTSEALAQSAKIGIQQADHACQKLLAFRTSIIALDEAVLAAYGWTGQVTLGHDFHEIETLPENDRVRYTISPAARKELLRRLLALNHQRAAEEKNQQLATTAKKSPAKKSASKKPQPAAEPDLFALAAAASVPFHSQKSSLRNSVSVPWQDREFVLPGKLRHAELAPFVYTRHWLYAALQLAPEGMPARRLIEAYRLLLSPQSRKVVASSLGRAGAKWKTDFKQPLELADLFASILNRARDGEIEVKFVKGELCLFVAAKWRSEPPELIQADAEAVIRATLDEELRKSFSALLPPLLEEQAHLGELQQLAIVS